MQHSVGQIVEGKISGITNFGLFVDLGDGISGLVHISEVSRTYVNDIKELYKVGDTVKMKIISIGDDGKISLSIKRALDPEKREQPTREKRERRPQPVVHKPDPSYTWVPKKAEPASFEEMMNRFKQTSDEKFSDLKKKNPEAKRSRRGAVK